MGAFVVVVGVHEVERVGEGEGEERGDEEDVDGEMHFGWLST